VTAEVRQLDARQNDEQRRAEAEATRRAADLRGWRLACQAHTFQAYEAYAKAFPNGMYHDVAVERYRAMKPFWKKDSFQQ